MNMRLSIRRPLALLTLLATALAFQAPAAAHGSTKPSHGGIVQVSGETLLELVVGPDAVALYVKEEDEDMPSAGMVARLSVAYKGAKSDVVLEPAAGNKFEGKGVKLGSGAKVGVVLTNKATQAKVAASFTVP